MAKRHPGSSRNRPRPKDPEDADVFVARTLEFSAWAKQNSQVLLAFVAAVALVVFLAVYYVNRSGERQMAAAQELEQVTSGLASGQVEQTKVELARYVERFENTPYAAEGRLVLAELHLDEGEPGQALQVLEASDLPLGDGLGTQIAILRARTLEALERFDEAARLYLEIADNAALAFQEVDALDDAARLRMQMGDWAGAAELYERLVDISPDGSQAASLYQMRLAEARARTS
jgi:predicted negative regulator of RcsB-dependent stress response